jgi:serine phosphatase RsbU (regulator of sigma subunit)
VNHSGFSRSLVAGSKIGVPASPLPPRQEIINRARERELELALRELRKDYADLRAALFEAAEVYRRLCAPRLLLHGEFEIASETFAARHLPGDFISIEEGTDSAILALGDISGKGLAAGMWTTLLLGLLRIHIETSAAPQAIVAGVNRDLCRMSIGSPLASLFLAKLDRVTGTLEYCSAGHPPALLLRVDGQLESLSEGGPLLGALPEASFAGGRTELQSGDVWVAYSDGILEARNHQDEEFGFDQLEAELRRARSGSADAILFSVLGAVQDFVGGCLQADDMSLVVTRR